MPWEKTDLGRLKSPKRSTGIFYNQVLPRFFSSFWPMNPNAKSFRAAFFLERKREWEITKKLQAYKHPQIFMR